MTARFYLNLLSKLALFNIVLGLGLALLPTTVSAQDSQRPSSGEDILQVNDLIRVTVFHEDDMLTEARISKSGFITLPLLGQVQVAGKSVADAIADIRA